MQGAIPKCSINCLSCTETKAVAGLYLSKSVPWTVAGVLCCTPTSAFSWNGNCHRVALFTDNRTQKRDGITGNFGLAYFVVLLAWVSIWRSPQNIFQHSTTLFTDLNNSIISTTGHKAYRVCSELHPATNNTAVPHSQTRDMWKIRSDSSLDDLGRGSWPNRHMWHALLAAHTRIHLLGWNSAHCTSIVLVLVHIHHISSGFSRQSTQCYAS